MPDPGPAVAVLGVTGVEPHIEGEGLVLGLALDELDSLVHDQVGLVTKGAVGLFLVERVAPDRGVDLEVVACLEALRHLGVPLAGEPGPVARLAQDSRVEMLDRLGGGKIVLPGSTEASAGEPRQDGGPADPADGLAHEGIGEARSLGAKAVDDGGLGKRMTIASEGARGLVVGKEKDDIGTLGVELGKEKKKRPAKKMRNRCFM